MLDLMMTIHNSNIATFVYIKNIFICYEIYSYRYFTFRNFILAHAIIAVFFINVSSMLFTAKFLSRQLHVFFTAILHYSFNLEVTKLQCLITLSSLWHYSYGMLGYIHVSVYLVIE
ncbi:hypothetical protein ACJX0J_040356 [Zea mays]